MRTIWRLTLALLLGAAPPLAAQTVLTLDDAIAQTMAHNPVLQGARAAADQSAAQLTLARSGFFPRLSFGESWQRSDEPVFVFGALLSSRRFAVSNFAVDRLNSPDSLSLYHGALAVGQTLFAGGRIRTAVDAANRQRQIAGTAVDRTRADLALAAVRAYGRVLAAQASQFAAASAGSAAEADLARAEHRRDAGTATDADVLAVAVHLADVRQREIQSAGDAAIARAELNRLMGAGVNDEFAVREPPPAGTITGELSALFAEADAASPEIKGAEAAVRLAEAGIRAARAAWFPEVSAQAGVDVNGTRFGGRATSWVAGAGLQWSVSTGGAEAARAHAAAAGATQARTALADTRAGVHVEVLTALRQIASARARADVGRATVEHTRERQRILRDRYDAGLASVNDVLQAAAAALDADTQRVSAVVLALVSDAMLRHALGRLPQPGTSR